MVPPFYLRMKSVVLIIMSLLISNSSIAKDSEAVLKFKIAEPMEGSKDNVFEDENIVVKFWPSYGEFCMNVENKRDERIYIEWENARTNGEKVMFGDDTRLTVKNTKSDESIPSNSVSLTRSLYKENPLYSSNSSFYSYALAIHKEIVGLKKLGGTVVSILLPIRFADNTTKDYKFRILVKYINTTDLSNVKIGTSAKEIKKNIGKPDYIKEIKGQNNVEIWVYTNNAELTIEKGKVSNINLNRE